jgi:hypothetical protein
MTRPSWLRGNLLQQNLPPAFEKDETLVDATNLQDESSKILILNVCRQSLPIHGKSFYTYGSTRAKLFMRKLLLNRFYGDKIFLT